LNQSKNEFIVLPQFIVLIDLDHRGLMHANIPKKEAKGLGFACINSLRHRQVIGASHSNQAQNLEEFIA